MGHGPVAISDLTVVEMRSLLSTLPGVPLRTLDAMHPVITREIDASILATADRIMAAGAHEMGFSVVRFFR